MREVARFATLPDRDTATMNPDLLFALGGVRVVAPGSEFACDHTESGEWMTEATRGRVGELDEADITGVMSQANKAGVLVLALFFVVLPLAGCLLTIVG
jgi:hypothetical protein